MSHPTDQPPAIPSDEALSCQEQAGFCTFRLAIDPTAPFGARVVVVSPSIRRLTGIENPADFASWFERIHPDDLDRVLKANRVALEQHRPYGQALRVFHPQKQRWVWLYIASNPVHDAGDNLTCYDGLMIDITELRERLQEEAAANERSRLARDLHDAVTQTLFSANLIAEALPRLWEKDVGEGRRRLEELRGLTRGVLAEMRTLLFDLRPSALAEADLDELVRRLVEVFTNRTRLPVALSVAGACSLPSEVRVALYRIAQEALNNVARHSRAAQVRVALSCDPGQAGLLIEDDGLGFDPTAPSPGHLGLNIMKERAGGIGALLEIDSRAGQGTRVRVCWPASAPEKSNE